MGNKPTDRNSNQNQEREAKGLRTFPLIGQGQPDHVLQPTSVVVGCA